MLLEAKSASVHGEVNKKNPMDEDLAKNLSPLVEIVGGILVLLKCIIILVCLVLIGIVYIVSRPKYSVTYFCLVLIGIVHIVFSSKYR
jgi:hypothetical protein